MSWGQISGSDGVDDSEVPEELIAPVGAVADAVSGADSDVEADGLGLEDGDADGEDEGEPVPPVGEGDALGVPEGELLGDGFGELEGPPPLCGLLVSGDGSAAPVGVGSSDVPIVPSGPGSLGPLVTPPGSPGPVSPPGVSPPRSSPPTPGPAVGLTPTVSAGAFGSVSEVAPRVTTVPRTATSRAPAPAATRLRLARPRRPPRPRWAGGVGAGRLVTAVGPVGGADGSAR